MYYFSVEKTLYYPKFVEWCVNNYSPNKRVIMNKNATRILCQVNANVIYEVLNVPNILLENTEPYWRTLVQVYRECKSKIKNVFLTWILKVGDVVESLSFPVDVCLFWEKVQLVLSILSQILGYDDDKSVTKVMIGFLLKTNLPEPETNQVWCFGFDEFLATTIHFQLAYFPKLIHFRY